MSSKEEREILKSLVQQVLRAFYEPKHVIVMDQLVRHPALKEDELAGRVGLQLKELSKITAKLQTDNLLKIYRQNELKGATRAQVRQYFYIDYQHFFNVVKWRTAEMHRIIDSKLWNELDNKSYICPQCRKQHSLLEVDRLIDFAQGHFSCKDCKAEVIESVKGSKDEMQRFYHQMRFIREGLRRTEEMVLPAFDVQDWLRKHPSEEAKRAAEGDGLKTAGANGEKKDDGMEIVMSVDKDEATRRAEREEEAEAKRKKKALPAWHTRSTITGELTALGHAAVVQTQLSPTTGSNAAILESLTNPSARSTPTTSKSSNAAILSGLGKAPKAVASTEPGVKIEQDAKPAQSKQTDHLDAYYNSLQQQVASAANTPTMDGWGTYSVEPEDRKPDLSYLNGSGSSYPPASPAPGTPYSASWNDRKSLAVNGNVLGKRSREEETFTFGGESGGEMALVEEVGFSQPESGDDPVVNGIRGKPMKFSEITEEDQERMSPEEYVVYYELVMARGN
ncbi:hypothetical protein M422DRAFT_157029 [Sphaerobolus stellatus SS14]|nr:hypothetical protein M422DRAFT_157029 [Sphaerobolus stellatus SS14]